MAARRAGATAGSPLVVVWPATVVGGGGGRGLPGWRGWGEARRPPCPAGEREAAEVRGLSSGWSGCAGEGGGAGNWWSGWIGGEKAVRTTTAIPNSTIIQYIYSNIYVSHS